MSTSTAPPFATGPSTPVSAEAAARRLRDVYALDRLREVIRAIVEDALDPTRSDETLWSADQPFAKGLGEAVTAVAEATDRELAGRLAAVLGSAAPKVHRRLSSAPRFPDHS
jgi:hypothetical protein